MYIFAYTHVFTYTCVYIYIYTCVCLHMCVFTYTCVCPLSLEFPPGRSSHSARLASLCYTAASHLLSVLYMVAYIRQSCSLSSPHPLLPLLCPTSLSSTSVSLLLPANRFISTILDAPVKANSVPTKKKDKNSNILNGKWIWENEKDTPIQ